MTSHEDMPIGQYTVLLNGKSIGTIHPQRIPILDSQVLLKLLDHRPLRLGDSIVYVLVGDVK